MFILTPAAAGPRRWGTWLLLLTLAWATATLWSFSDGALSVYVDMVVLYLGAGLLGIAAIVTLVAGSVTKSGERARGRGRWVPLTVTGVVMAVVPSLCRYNVPFKARFASSEPALLAAVKEGAPASAPRWIGLFRVQHVDAAGGATRLTTGACGLAARCGVAYVRGGRPTVTEGATYKPLHGPWWLFEQR